MGNSYRITEVHTFVTKQTSVSGSTQYITPIDKVELPIRMKRIFISYDGGDTVARQIQLIRNGTTYLVYGESGTIDTNGTQTELDIVKEPLDEIRLNINPATAGQPVRLALTYEVLSQGLVGHER